MTFKLPIAIALSLLLGIVLATSAVTSVSAQQKRQAPAKPQPAPATTPAPVPTPPPPTFDTLLAANSYKIYGEVRSVGQLVRSNSVNEVLEPILKFAGPPKEFKSIIKWLNTHADEVMTSRMLVAFWPTVKEVPTSLVAIEFASAEEAAKFQVKLNDFLPKVLPSATREKSPAPGAQTEPQLPPYHIKRAGSLILITPTPLTIQKLRPAGSKLLADDSNFRVARNRFNSESIFVFIDVAEIEKEEAQQLKQAEQMREQALEANKEAVEKAQAEAQKEIEEAETPEPAESKEVVVVGVTSSEIKDLPIDGQLQQPIQGVESGQANLILGMLFSSFAGAEAKWPQAIGVAISLEGESFDARALMINAPGEKSDPIPFLPILAPGPPIVPEAPSILPADTEMLIALSLDLPQIYSTLMKPPDHRFFLASGADPGKEGELETPYAAIEKRLKIKIKDDLLPLLGSEIVLTIPANGLDWFQPPAPPPSATSSAGIPVPSPSRSATLSAGATAPDEKKKSLAPAIALSLKDKEGMRVLLPKLIEGLAFKGAAAFAQTERREDTELVSYANTLGYAFIGNFVILSPDIATVRHIVDSYLKKQTLSGEPHFKNYTRWQPRQLQGQLYISPALMESYRALIQQPTLPLDDQTRSLLAQLSVVAQPITYSLSNEGFGPLHELHVPKNLVLMMITGVASSFNQPVNPPAPTNPN